MSGAAAIAALALSLESRAAPPPELVESFSSGTQQIALLVSGVIGLPTSDHEVGRTRTLGVFPRWSIGLSDPLARGALYEGNLEFDVEPMVLLNFHPRFGWAAGGSLLLHYNFLRAKTIVPFIEGGGGASHLAFRLDSQSDGFTFPLQFSLGLHAPTFSRGALTASVGYFHLSNAGLHFPNYGVNAVMLRIGISFLPGAGSNNDELAR